MKWADKIDLRERARASDEAVAHLMSPWARSNLDPPVEPVPDCACTAGTTCRQNNACPRLVRPAPLCPICGERECDSALCEQKRRKAEQQAKAQSWAARDGVTGDAR